MDDQFLHGERKMTGQVLYSWCKPTILEKQFTSLPVVFIAVVALHTSTLVFQLDNRTVVLYLE